LVKGQQHNDLTTLRYDQRESSLEGRTLILFYFFIFEYKHLIIELFLLYFLFTIPCQTRLTKTTKSNLLVAQNQIHHLYIYMRSYIEARLERVAMHRLQIRLSLDCCLISEDAPARRRCCGLSLGCFAS
jgi:hypothetical protein